MAAKMLSKGVTDQRIVDAFMNEVNDFHLAASARYLICCSQSLAVSSINLHGVLIVCSPSCYAAGGHIGRLQSPERRHYDRRLPQAGRWLMLADSISKVA